MFKLIQIKNNLIIIKQQPIKLMSYSNKKIIQFNKFKNSNKNNNLKIKLLKNQVRTKYNNNNK